MKEKNSGFMLKYKIIILCFFCCLKLFAQDFEFENISTINGLSQNDVNCMIQDKQGFMWFGTNDGLNRYDGYEFNIYRYDVDGDKGLNSNRIKSLAEDQNHNIWVGTNDGVNILQYLNQSILNLSSFHEKQFPLMDKESVVGIDIIDHLSVVLTKEAVFFFKVLEDGYEPIKVDNKYFIKTGSTLTNCYYRVSNNEFIIGTKHGLKWFRLHRDKELKIDITNHEKKINVLSIVPFKDGFLSICRDGLYYIDEHSKFNPVLPGEFNCLLVEDENRFWVGNNFGLHHIVFENDALKKIIKREHYTNQNTNGGLGSNFVTSIYKDKQGVIWLGTSGGGLSKLIKRNNKFKLFRNKQEGTNFKENIINCFFEDSNRNLWLGTGRSGILYFSSGIYDYHVAPKQIYDSKKTMDDILAIHEIVISNKLYVIASTSNHLDIRVYNTNAQLVTNLLLYNALHKTTHPVSIKSVGVQLVRLGRQSITNDDYGFPYKDENIAFLKNIPVLDYASAPDLDKQFGHLIQPLTNQLPITVQTKDGKNAFGVMSRYAKVNGKSILLLVNLKANEVDVRLINSQDELLNGYDMLNMEAVTGDAIPLTDKGVRLINLDTQLIPNE